MLISERSWITMSAPLCLSVSPVPLRSIPSVRPKFPFLPASTPETASSTTMHSPGIRPRFFEAVTNMSGSGFPFRLSCCDTSPSTRVSKRSSIPASCKINLQLRLEDATPTLMPFLFRPLINFIDVSNMSGPSRRKTF